MEGLFLSTVATCSTSGNACGFRSRAHSFLNFRNYRNNISMLPRKPQKNLRVFASSGNESELNKLVSRELEMGKFLGEDPQLTLAKIVGRKLYPEMTVMELQKLYEKEGKAAFPGLDKLPFLSDIKKKPPVKRKTGNSEKKEVSSNVSEINGLKLVRPPVPKEGFKYELSSKPGVTMKRIHPAVKTVEKPVISGPSISLRKPTSFIDANNEKSSIELAERQRQDRRVDSSLAKKPNPYISENRKEAKSLQSGPSINLRRPTSFHDNKIETDKSLELSEEWDSSIELAERQRKDRLIDSSLVNKPNPHTSKNGEEGKSLQSDPGITLKKPTNFYENIINADKLLKLNKEWDALIEVFDTMSKKRLRKPESYISENNEEASQEAKAVVKNEIKTNNIIPLLQKTEIVNLDLNDDQKRDKSVKAIPTNETIESEISTIVSLLQNPEITNLDLDADPKQEDSGVQRESNSGISKETVNTRNTDLDQSLESLDYSAFMQGQPKRIVVNLECSNIVEDENFSAKLPIKEHVNRDWERAEELIKVGRREEVELISASTEGFAVSFGSLIGFLPFRNVGTLWRYPAFELWLRKKGLDPSNYKQNLGFGGKYEDTDMITFLDSIVNLKASSEVEVGSEISPDMKLDDLLVIYNQEKLRCLTSLVGQKLLVYVVLADRESKKLIFSSKQKEKEESIEKKMRLMAKLSIGDTVKCCITNITYFGVFVEVEGVSALVHQSEFSWDDTLDPSSTFKIGQVIDAKVTELDFSSGRIYLSLKEIMLDPLIETLESALINQASLKAVKPDMEWAEVDLLVKELKQYEGINSVSKVQYCPGLAPTFQWAEVDLLVKELKQYEGIESVSKGQYFLCPGLAPTFQVYMASMFEDQYKLLARSENKVQEVYVKASLSKEEMKNAISTCTNRVK